MAEQLYKEVSAFRIAIARHQFLILAAMSEELDGLYAFITADVEDANVNNVDAIKELINHVYTMANNLVVKMQKDLNLPKLHQNLFQRSKPRGWSSAKQKLLGSFYKTKQ